MSRAKWDKEKNQVTTDVVRLNFPSLLTPKRFKKDEKAQYQAFVMVPKKDAKTVKALKLACKMAEKETFPRGRPKGKFIFPLMAGNRYAKDRGYEVNDFSDYIIFKSKSDFPVIVVGPDGKTELKEGADDKYIYSGCNARVVVTCKGYDDISKGIGFYLNMVQVLAGGDSLVSRPDPEDFFDEEADFGEDDSDEDSEEDFDDDDIAF